MTVAQSLGRFAAHLALEAVPPRVRDVARAAIVDTVGVTLAGAREPASRLVAELVREEGGQPRATAIGLGFRCSPAQAALVNGTAGHALDYDDVHLTVRGHPSVVVTPAVLAAAEQVGASGREVLVAYVVGVEVIVNLARGIGKSHYLSGWHATSTLGTLGAAAACARLLGGTAEQIATAVAIAASLASGLRQNFGTDTKPLHAGHAARCGLQAAVLAVRGFTADPRAIEAAFGLLSLYSRDGDAAAITARLGSDWGLENPGLSVKRFPCCYATHHAAAAALELRSEYSIRPDAVETVEVLVPPGATSQLIHDRPSTGLEGKFSMPYVIAAALFDGRLTLETFTDAQVKRPELQAFLPRVIRREADGPPVGGDDPRFAEVTVVLRDGRRLRRRVEHPPGAPQNPLTDAELAEKFRDCAQVVLSPRAADAALERLGAIDDLPNLDELMKLLAGSAG